MKTNLVDVMPTQIRRSLTKVGVDLSLARRKRALTEAMMAERMNVSRSTYRRMEAGDPSVGMGVYAMAFFVLGLGTPLATIASSSADEMGLALDAENVPKRVRPKKKPQGF